MPKDSIILLRPVAALFAFLAALGFVASLIVHANAWAGRPSPFGDLTWSLHIGIFLVFIPAAILSSKQTPEKGSKKDSKKGWEFMLRGCPGWMRKGLFVLFPYVLVNFFGGIILGIGSESGSYRVFSGHWLLFYYVAMAMLISTVNLRPARPRACPEGHEVSALAESCAVCGSAVRPPPIA